MRSADAAARILQLERERDELFRANLRLRDVMLKRAKDCKKCGGTGCEKTCNDSGRVVAALPCPECKDFRAVLAQ
jgi:hypothetical protein